MWARVMPNVQGFMALLIIMSVFMRMPVPNDGISILKTGKQCDFTYKAVIKECSENYHAHFHERTKKLGRIEMVHATFR